MPVSKEFLDEIALSEGEYREIVRLLGREPAAPGEARKLLKLAG